ncbi:cytochrome P460 family protein [Halomonas sp. M4R1S46]|uniref:cytochrome P460 family protein n=1 Tax=Halomonas sp. M4R1S46 TaxID=2982692 RepID=UPI0021E4230B|nr:cytochrome P460 family protein [Halomonas sp. M4R1S46]UYG09329.1 cytochrome P460 family protein [Halomonas sp. M4R1S46]
MKTIRLLGTLGVGLLIGGQAALAQQAPFGGDEDVAYAEALWSALQEANLVGEGRTMSAPYTGQHPHGAILGTIDGEVTVDGTTGPVIVKRNYGGEGASKETVWNAPDDYLGAVTVMFKREGYDPDNSDWFWVKYLPSGELDSNPAGVPLAGRVAKGMDQGCIACHAGAPGGDMVFGHDRIQ